MDRFPKHHISRKRIKGQEVEIQGETNWMPPFVQLRKQYEYSQKIEHVRRSRRWGLQQVVNYHFKLPMNKMVERLSCDMRPALLCKLLQNRKHWKNLWWKCSSESVSHVDRSWQEQEEGQEAKERRDEGKVKLKKTEKNKKIVAAHI